MVSKVRTSAGTKLYVAPAPVTYDVAGFAASFTASGLEVGEVTDLGSFGKKFASVKFNPLGDRKTIKRKGSYDNGTISLKLGSSVTDAGQVYLEAASESDNSQSFKVVTQSGSIYYFSGQVMSFMLNIGSVDQIMGADCDVELDGDVLKGILVA